VNLGFCEKMEVTCVPQVGNPCARWKYFVQVFIGN